MKLSLLPLVFLVATASAQQPLVQAAQQSKGSKSGSKSKPPSSKRGRSAAQLSLPLTGSGLRGTLGSYRTYTKDKSQSFYSLGYGNTSLFSRGNAYTGTVIADSDPINFGSLPFELDMGNGKTQFGGTVIHNLNTIPLKALQFIPSPIFKVKDPAIRIIAGYDAQTQNNPQQHLVFGLEYRPHLNTAGAPSKKAATAPKPGSNLERFVAVALATERHTDSASGTSQTVPAAEFRGRVGIGFDFVTSKSRIAAARQNVQAALGQLDQERAKLQDAKSGLMPDREAMAAAFAVTRDDARNLANRFGLDPPAPERSGLLSGDQENLSLADESNELDDTAGHSELTQENLVQVATSRIDQIDRLSNIYKTFLGLGDKEAAKSVYRDTPLLSLFLEFDGSYALKNEILYSRSRSIWSANAKLDLDRAIAGSSFLWFRYENGFSRAEPNLRVNAFTVTLGFCFP